MERNRLHMPAYHKHSRHSWLTFGHAVSMLNSPAMEFNGKILYALPNGAAAADHEHAEWWKERPMAALPQRKD